MFKILNHKSIIVLVLLSVGTPAFAQWDVTERDEKSAIDEMKHDQVDMKKDVSSSVELQADHVEYVGADNEAKATGNVTLKSGPSTMYADEIIMNRTRQEASARGNVYLDSPQFQVDAYAGKFSFTEATGQFDNARMFTGPFQLSGASIAKVSQNHMVMERGYMTTCDHDMPHFRMATKHMDVYAGDKAVARGVKMYLGRVPVMYLPKFTQNLKDKPWFTFTPGSKKDLGYFLLTRSRIKINEYITSTLRVDLYERQGIGLGMDHKYSTKGMGSGLLRHYFINERNIGAKHPWSEKTIPTIQNERYKLEWRHKWDIDEKTGMIAQYYRLSDDVILKKYFEQENRVETNSDSYFLLTRSMPHGTASFRVDHRFNRFVTAVDRTPEVKYDLSGLPIGESGFYVKSSNSFVNLVKRFPSPTEDRRKTMRFDTDNEISYPTHISFVRFTPFIGGDNTYYTRTIDDVRSTNVLRSTFKTGADLTTRFMKVFAPGRTILGMKTPSMRHIIVPSIAYKYQHIPNFVASRLNQFDSIDALDQQHTIGYSLENKWQVKDGKKIIDLVRNLTSMDYTLRQKGVKGQLGDIKNLLEVTPNDWSRASLETIYDHKKNRLKENNLDYYVKASDKFGFDIGDRFSRGGNHQLVTQLAFVINPKWRLKTYHRYEFNSSVLKEEGYTITRDLHEWEMDITYNQTRGRGVEFLLSFTLKAFPGQPLDLFGTTFHQRKAGSQSSTNDF